MGSSHRRAAIALLVLLAGPHSAQAKLAAANQLGDGLGIPNLFGIQLGVVPLTSQPQPAAVQQGPWFGIGTPGALAAAQQAPVLLPTTPAAVPIQAPARMPAQTLLPRRIPVSQLVKAPGQRVVAVGTASPAGPVVAPVFGQLLGPLGWLLPVLTTTQRDCLVYQGASSENLQQISELFGLNSQDVLADNQGVINSPLEPLAGKSILLCGRDGRTPQLVAKPPRAPAAAAPGVMPPPRAPPATALPRPAAAGRPLVAAGQQVSRGATPVLLPAAAAPASQRALGIPPAEPLVPPALQKQALMELKRSLDATGRVLVDWVDTLDYCTFAYVTCDANKNVVRLNMVYTNLGGVLPPGNVMAGLPHLKQIYLGGNNLKGTLPADWGATLKATELFLNDNGLKGSIPAEWAGMSDNLRVLSLPYNSLSGTLPAALGKLSKLEVLKLNDNILSGSVPQAWGDLTSLSTLTLFNNQGIVGCVPEIWSGKGTSGKGYFQSPEGLLSSDVKVATLGTAIQGFCCKGWRYCV